MGKKPLVGVVGALCLGLSLNGCESCGCNQKSTPVAQTGSVYQGQPGNMRNLVSNPSQPSTPATTPQALQPATSSGWATLPGATATTTQPSITNIASPMPTGPTNTGPLLPTNGLDNSRNQVTPATGAPTPVSSSSWPMKAPADPAIQQTSAISTDATQLPLGNPQAKGSFTTSQRMTDGYNGVTTSQNSASQAMIPAPPPLPRSMVSASSSTLPPMPTPEVSNALMAPPPASSGGVSNSSSPPAGGLTDSVPPLPPVPGTQSSPK
jgi:hypothetical protein